MPINERTEKIIAYINVNGEINNTKARELLNVSDSTAKQLLQKMVDIGLLVALGQKKGRKYTLK